MNRLHGIVGAPGIAFGVIAQVSSAGPQEAAASVDQQEPRARLSAAQTQVAEQLQQLARELRDEGNTPEAAIFDAQAMLAIDPALTTEALRLIDQEQAALPDAVLRATEAMATQLSNLDDAYLRERAADVRAVGQQVVATLTGAPTEIRVPTGSIAIARDLTPAQTATLRKARIAGFATASGTRTGHVAILARALGLPAVVGIGDSVLAVPDGVPAILAADEGMLIVEPSAEERATYQQRRAAAAVVMAQRDRLLDLPAQTTDGHRIGLWANIGHPDEAQHARKAGAEGIGLFRTEFLFLDRSAPPSEEEQFAAYASAVQVMAGRSVVIRTLDIGGDKPIPYLPQPHETNPFLGWRGVRFAMRFQELFQIQLRALLRAAATGDLRIMLPMVATPADVAWFRTELAMAAAGLTEQGAVFHADVPLGIMVETPAAALTLDLLAPGIRFCSIGTNDLSQYTLAADRSDPQLAERYQHTDPAVFRMISAATTAARRLGLHIGVCGELASEPQAAVALVGLGIETLSMTPTALRSVKEAIRAVSLREARHIAKEMCAETT